MKFLDDNFEFQTLKKRLILKNVYSVEFPIFLVKYLIIFQIFNLLLRMMLNN